MALPFAISLCHEELRAKNTGRDTMKWMSKKVGGVKVVKWGFNIRGYSDYGLRAYHEIFEMYLNVTSYPYQVPTITFIPSGN